MKETVELAIEALENAWTEVDTEQYIIEKRAITALRQAIAEAEQAQLEFTTHAVKNAYDWSEWVCPDPKGYLMKCCDCGLVHEAEFKVVRYKSETEHEDCEPVDDPNVQAVFRMRRIEQWTPEDMAHRAGGLPIEQAQKQEPVVCGGEQEAPYIGHDCAPYMTDSMKVFCPACCTKFRAIPSDVQKLLLDAGFEPPFDTPAPQRQPLTDDEIWKDDGIMAANSGYGATFDTLREIVRAIEAAHGIGKKK